MWTNDVRYLPGKSNCVADTLSRPATVPLGQAYQGPSLVDIPDNPKHEPDIATTKQLKELTKGTFVPGTSSFFEELNWN